MSVLGNIMTSRQYFAMALDGLIRAEAHAMAGRPLNRSEAEDVEAYLRKAANAMRDALEIDGKVVPLERWRAPNDYLKAGAPANPPASLPDADTIGRIFGPDALLIFPTINTELPSDTEAPSDQPPRRA